MAARSRLSAGTPVNQVALDLGYDRQPQRISTMFRMALGAPSSSLLHAALTPHRRTVRRGIFMCDVTAALLRRHDLEAGH